MITQKLRILVLKHLSHGPHSGYQLIKEIKEQTGWKPSYGSIYPLLEQLKEEGLATCRESGKRKLYSITSKGKTALHLFTKHHDAIIRQVEEWQKVMAHLCDAENDPFFEHITSSIQRGQIPFKGILKSSYQFRSELTRLSKEGLLDERKDEVIAIIEEATRKLRGIRSKGKIEKRIKENEKW